MTDMTNKIPDIILSIDGNNKAVLAIKISDGGDSATNFITRQINSMSETNTVTGYSIEDSIKTVNGVFNRLNGVFESLTNPVDLFFYSIVASIIFKTIEMNASVSVRGNKFVVTVDNVQYYINIENNIFSISDNLKNDTLIEGVKKQESEVIKDAFQNYYEYLATIRNYNTFLKLIDLDQDEIKKFIDLSWKVKGYMYTKVGISGIFDFRPGTRNSYSYATITRNYETASKNEMTITLKESDFPKKIRKETIEIVQKVINPINEKKERYSYLRKFDPKFHSYATSNNAVQNKLGSNYRRIYNRMNIFYGESDHIVIGNLPTTVWPNIFIDGIFFANVYAADIYSKRSNRYGQYLHIIPEWTEPMSEDELKDYEEISKKLSTEIKKNKTLFQKIGTKYHYSLLSADLSDAQVKRAAIDFAVKNVIIPMIPMVKTKKYKTILTCLKDRAENDESIQYLFK